MDETGKLLLISNLAKLGLITGSLRKELERRIRSDRDKSDLCKVLVRQHGLDQATLNVLVATIESTLSGKQSVTRIERKRAKGQPPEHARERRTGVQVKVQALAAEGQDAPVAVTAPDATARYQFHEMLGVGGVGVVHLAHDKALKRRVAVKTLRPELKDDPRWVRALMYESVITGNLEHPSIIPIYDLGVLDNDEFFYSMKYLDGPSLREVIDETRAQRIAGAHDTKLTEHVLLYRQICSGVDYAHSRGVIHRDLKPSNIHVGGHGEVAIMDWGIAMGIEGDWPSWSRATGELRGIGTYEYAAPEQVLDHDSAPAFQRDIYSLGVILYELLALELPYGAYTDPEDLRERSKELPPLLSSRSYARVSDGLLDAICLRALNHDPAQRYERVATMIRELDEYIAGTREQETLNQLSIQEQQTADALMKTYVGLVSERASIRASLTEIRGQVSLMVADDIRVEIGRLHNRIKNVDVLAGQHYTEILTHLNRARGYTPDSAPVLRSLFRLYRTRLEDAREAFDVNDIVFYGNGALDLARAIGDDHFVGPASLSIRSYPEGAEISIVSYAEISRSKRQLHFSDGRPLGKTPLMGVPLAAGSYLIMARKPGYVDEHRFVFLVGSEQAHLLVTLEPLSMALGEGGRERELHDLQLFFQDALNQERVRFALLQGVPGSGILHIANSFKDFLEKLDYFVAFISVDCRQLHAEIPFYVISDMIKFRSGLRQGDLRADKRKRLYDMLLVPLTNQGKRVLPGHAKDKLERIVELIGALPSIDLPASDLTSNLRRDPEAFRAAIFDALAFYFESLASWMPVIIILHNAQWVDPTSMEFLSRLHQRSRGKPLFVIGMVERDLGGQGPAQRVSDTTTKQPLPSRWATAPLDHRMPLRPLDAETMERTIAKLVNGAPSTKLVNFLLERSQGLPYVTEFLISKLAREKKLYQRQGDREWVQKKTAERLAVYSVAAVVAEEFASLPEDEATHLRAAAVVGRIFWSEALSRVLPVCDPEVLVRLTQKRWIVEHAHSRYSRTEEYTFTMNTLQEQIYETVPREERDRVHRLVARWQWEQYHGALEEMSLLSHHYAGCGDEPEATIFLQRIGDTCRRFGASEEALANYRRLLGMRVDAQRREDVESAVLELEAAPENKSGDS